jgi:hypothetical protein
MKRVLIIAADADLRRSVQFALEAEGYIVTCRVSLAAHERPQDFDCTVVDHHVLGSEHRAARAFFQSFSPVILLANAAPHPLSPWARQTLLKPMLGPALSAAIRGALESRSAPT